MTDTDHRGIALGLLAAAALAQENYESWRLHTPDIPQHRRRRDHDRRVQSGDRRQQVQDRFHRALSRTARSITTASSSTPCRLKAARCAPMAAGAPRRQRDRNHALPRVLQGRRGARLALSRDAAGRWPHGRRTCAAMMPRVHDALRRFRIAAETASGQGVRTGRDGRQAFLERRDHRGDGCRRGRRRASDVAACAACARAGALARRGGEAGRHSPRRVESSARRAEGRTCGPSRRVRAYRRDKGSGARQSSGAGADRDKTASRTSS